MALLAGCGGDDAKKEGNELADCLRGKKLKVSQVLEESLKKNPTYDALDKSAEGYGGTVMVGQERPGAPTVVFFVMKDPEEAKKGKKALEREAPGAEVNDNIVLAIRSSGKSTRLESRQRKAIDSCLDGL